ncbi:hypothetical protein ACLKA6_012801 [Drosophila palustris]
MSDAANTIIKELVLATSAYRTAAVAKNPFSVRRPAPVDNSPPFNIYVFGLKDTVGNISGRPTSQFRVELDHHDNNDSFLKLVTLGSFEASIDKMHKHKPIVQCFKCQGFGHISSDCINPDFVCCKCAGSLNSRDCLVISESDMLINLTEAIADISNPEEIEAMLVDYITNEESQDTAALTNEADKEPARIAPQEQILPRSLFIPKTDNATDLIENAEGVAGTNSFTANFTASGGIIIQPLTLEAHDVLSKYFQSLNLCTDSSNAPKLKAIIEGLHSTVSTDWISAKLTSLGFGVIHVENTVGSQSGTPTNKFRAELPQNPTNKLIFKVTKLGPFIVTMLQMPTIRTHAI